MYGIVYIKTYKSWVLRKESSGQNIGIIMFQYYDMFDKCLTSEYLHVHAKLFITKNVICYLLL